MEMTAAVRDKQDGTTTCITSSSYSTKKQFRDELYANGYAVIGRIFCDQDMNTASGRRYYCNGIRSRSEVKAINELKAMIKGAQA